MATPEASFNHELETNLIEHSPPKTVIYAAKGNRRFTVPTLKRVVEVPLVN